jgi:hypothetical protein
MTREQDTEIVEQRRAPPAAAPGVLNRPLPRWVTVPLAVAAGLAVVLLALNFPVLHVYQRYFTQDLPRTQVPWTQLSAAMDEAALRAALPGLSLRCMAQPTAMGERTCFAAVREVDGYPALTVALFLRAGRLHVATVQVPWWAHGRAAATLERQFGASVPASDGGSTRLRRWRLASGYLDMNARRSLNVLAWSAIVWTPRVSAPE